MSAFGLTDAGFNRMLETDVYAALVQDLAPLFGVDPNTTTWPTTASPLAQLLAPFARQLGLVWELAEAAFASTDPLLAFGTLMDGLLALNNLARLEATSSVVTAVVSGSEGSVVPLGTRASVEGSGDLFAATQAATITKAACLRIDVEVSTVSSLSTPYAVTVNGNVVDTGVLSGSPTRDTIAQKLLAALNASSLVHPVAEAVYAGSAVVQVATVANLTAYTVTLGGVPVTYTSDASATGQEIVDGLVAALNAAQDAVAATGVSSTTFSLVPRVTGRDWEMLLTTNLAVASLTPTGKFSLKAQDLTTTFSTLVDSRMAIDQLYTPQPYASVATGPIEAAAGTLTVIETPVSGLQAIGNLLDAVPGRLAESDDQARVRREQTLSTGSSSTQAMVAELFRAVPGITLVRAYENTGDNPDAEGRPGHSVELLVEGGSDAAVAQVVWDTRSAGIVPYGNVNADGTVDPDGSGTGIAVVDSNGDAQTAHFSRPEVLFGFVHVTKTLYSEEVYPATGDAAIAQALVAYGNGLTMGQDLLNQRFVAAAVNLPGVASLAITIAVGHDPLTAPVADNNPTAGDRYFTSSNLAVGTRQRVAFDSSRVTVT